MGTEHRGTEKVEGRDRADISFLVLLGPGPGDGIRGGTGRPGDGDRCWIAPARFPQLRPQICGARPCTSQRRLLRRGVALAIYTLLKIACETSFQSAQAEFELDQ